MSENTVKAVAEYAVEADKGAAAKKLGTAFEATAMTAPASVFNFVSKGKKVTLEFEAKNSEKLMESIRKVGPHIDDLVSHGKLAKLDCYGEVSDELKTYLKPFGATFHPAS